MGAQALAQGLGLLGKLYSDTALYSFQSCFYLVCVRLGRAPVTGATWAAPRTRISDRGVLEQGPSGMAWSTDADVSTSQSITTGCRI